MSLASVPGPRGANARTARGRARTLQILAAYAALDPAAGRICPGGCCDVVSLEMRLRHTLRGEARRFESLTCAEIAALLASEGRRLEGRALLALLWVLARNRNPGVRPLEERVVCEVERRSLSLLVSSPLEVPS